MLDAQEGGCGGCEEGHLVLFCFDLGFVFGFEVEAEATMVCRLRFRGGLANEE